MAPSRYPCPPAAAHMFNHRKQYARFDPNVQGIHGPGLASWRRSITGKHCWAFLTVHCLYSRIERCCDSVRCYTSWRQGSMGDSNLYPVEPRSSVICVMRLLSRIPEIFPQHAILELDRTDVSGFLLFILIPTPTRKNHNTNVLIFLFWRFLYECSSVRVGKLMHAAIVWKISY